MSVCRVDLILWFFDGFIESYIRLVRWNNMMEYHHADEVLRSSQGHGLFVGDVQAAENVEWL